MTIYKFIPYLKPVIWGGEKIALRKGITDSAPNIGESWEISGVEGHESIVANGVDKGINLKQLVQKYKGALLGKRVYEKFGDRFPLLVKIIDASQNLSVQVHPNDDIAKDRHNGFGKTEMWYVLESVPDAKIYVGLDKEISREDFVGMVENNTIMDVVAEFDSHPGDLFFIPPGRIHSIGAGNLLVEIQQTSDITYRIYDYDRRDADGMTRELHVDLACDALDFAIDKDCCRDYDRESYVADLIRCNYFNVSRIMIEDELEIEYNTDSFMIILCTEGSCTVSAKCDKYDNATVELKAYETALIPAEAKLIIIDGKATVLTATVN